MRSSAAQILETALALQRAPGERFRLRERPLPSGVIHLIEVAAGSPQAIQAAAVELGEPEPKLIEAARFYLEQVLFADPDANAYRVLGVAPDAPHEAIRVHQRWLQRWLHPDRAMAGDASIFATRVNQAFAQLRTPELRHDYDVRLAESRMAGASAPLTSETLRHWEGGDEIVVSGTGRRSRWLLAAALVSCAVLAVLIVRNPENAVAWNPEGDDVAEAAPAGAHDAPAIQDRDLGVLSEALSVASAQPQLPDEPPNGVVVPTALLDAVGEKPALGLEPVAPRVLPAPHRHVPTTAPVAAMKPSLPKGAESLSPSLPASPQTQPGATLAGPRSEHKGEATEASGADMRPPAPADPDLTKERMRLAERGVEQVVGYFGAKSGAFPLWNDPAVQDKAAQLRGALNARSGSFELKNEIWEVRADRARLDAAYYCRAAASGTCEGRLLVDLVWRQGLWFVQGVSLAPPA